MQKTILITGATRGLGLSLARVYRANGDHVIGLARDATALAELEAVGVLNDTLVCDLADTTQIDSAVLAIENRYEQIDVLVHNAGIQSSYDILETPEFAQLVQREMAVNFLAPVRLTTGLLPQILKGKGQIAVVTSLLQRVSKPAAPGYCASKAALASWTASLRYQLRNRSVEVCEVVPGLMRTDMTPKGRQAGHDPDVLAQIIVRRLPRHRLVLPGARIGWFLGNVAPGFLQRLLNSR